jgi:hypothetical protein
MSSLALVTVEHLATGLVILAGMMDPSRRGDRIGLLINAAVIGVLGVVAFRLIHKKRWLTPWLLIGTIPSLVGAYLIFWRYRAGVRALAARGRTSRAPRC